MKRRYYWLLYAGKAVDSYFRVAQKLRNGNVRGHQYMLNKETSRVVAIRGVTEIAAGNLGLWKRTRAPRFPID